jgi:hypothetical protein
VLDASSSTSHSESGRKDMTTKMKGKQVENVQVVQSIVVEG